MDRFIGEDEVFWEHLDRGLKSNMDRFIVKNTCRIAATAYMFKIQYG